MSELYPTALLITAGLETAGRWIAGYVLLSLLLGLIWVALVTAGRFYQRRPTASLGGWTGPRPASLAVGLWDWHRENEEFARQFLDVEDSLGAARPGKGSDSDPQPDSSLRAE